METTIVNVTAFPGFYESWLSQEIDHVEEQESEWMAEKQTNGDDPDYFQPEHLRLEVDDFAELFFDCTDYSIVHLKMADLFSQGFDSFASGILGFDVGLKFESMASPKYYNYETDRLFVHIPLETLGRLFWISASEGHETLQKCLKERCTSYEGFHSYYSNDLQEWLAKPLDTWDHNEIAALLDAVIVASDPEAFEDWSNLYYAVFDGSEQYECVSAGIDWEKLEAKTQEKRDELQEAYDAEHADDPYYVAPYRCSLTIDLFLP